MGLSKEEKLKRGEISYYNKYKQLVKSAKDEQLVILSKKFASDEVIIKEAWHKSVIETSALSGGYADFVEKPEDAEIVYNTIFQTIANRYVIGYYPKNETKDGNRRTVKIEVKNHPEYIVIGRKSYIAPLEKQ